MEVGPHGQIVPGLVDMELLVVAGRVMDLVDVLVTNWSQTDVTFLNVQLVSVTN